MNQSIALVKVAHSAGLKTGSLADLHVVTRILVGYCKCDGTFKYARQLFDEFAVSSSLDVICWNSIISGCVRNRRDEEAFKYFKLMQCNHQHLGPDSFTLSSLLSSAHCLQRNVSLGEQLHGYASKNGTITSLSVQNALITLYAKWGRLVESRQVFDSMVGKKNTVSWTAVISGLAQHRGYEEECLKLFVAMMREKDGDVLPNQFTFSTVFSSCARLGLSQGMPLLTVVLKMGLFDVIHVQNSLLGFFAECGLLEEAKVMFDSINIPDLVSWNSLLKGYSQHGRVKEAFEVFERMQKFVKPDSIALLSILSAYRHAGLVTTGTELFKKMKIDFGVEPRSEHISCMVDLLGRAGKLREAEDFVKGVEIEVGDSVWRTYLGACRAHREYGELTEFAASKILEMDPYDSEAHIALSQIYAASGQWDKVVKLRSLFKEKRLVKEPGISWIELGSRVHSFAASDWGHPLIIDIQTTVMQLTNDIKRILEIPLL